MYLSIVSIDFLNKIKLDMHFILQTTGLLYKLVVNSDKMTFDF